MKRSRSFLLLWINIPVNKLFVSLIDKYEELKNRQGQFSSMDVYTGHPGSLITAPGFLNERRPWHMAMYQLDRYRDLQGKFTIKGQLSGLVNNYNIHPDSG